MVLFVDMAVDCTGNFFRKKKTILRILRPSVFSHSLYPKRTFSSGTNLRCRKQPDASPAAYPSRQKGSGSTRRRERAPVQKKKRARRQAIERLPGFSPPSAWRLRHEPLAP
jgi:hypothetical protein